jgi:RNA polymerase subunit RPABC4/transcription elongation factor Spt4
MSPNGAEFWIEAGLVIGILAAAYTAILWVTLIIWTHRDIQARTTDSATQSVAVLLVAVFFIPGLVLYLGLRPADTLQDQHDRAIESQAMALEVQAERRCLHCSRRVEADFVVCPHCAAPLKSRCDRCERAVETSWSACAYCGAPIGGQTRVAATAARPRPVPAARIAVSGNRRA